ncbi:MAG: thioredoxin family protein [Synergistaceae bacterium]|nr:thioredoxin family protein [Synergistaceae bacterium]
MSEKKILAFFIEGCPYCKQAREAVKELSADYNVNIEWVDENKHPEISAKYDYYFVPSMFVDGKKIYESHRGESKQECFANVKKVFEAAN